MTVWAQLIFSIMATTSFYAATPTSRLFSPDESTARHNGADDRLKALVLAKLGLSSNGVKGAYNRMKVESQNIVTDNFEANQGQQRADELAKISRSTTTVYLSAKNMPTPRHRHPLRQQGKYARFHFKAPKSIDEQVLNISLYIHKSWIHPYKPISIRYTPNPLVPSKRRSLSISQRLYPIELLRQAAGPSDWIIAQLDSRRFSAIAVAPSNNIYLRIPLVQTAGEKLTQETKIPFIKLTLAESEMALLKRHRRSVGSEPSDSAEPDCDTKTDCCLIKKDVDLSDQPDVYYPKVVHYQYCKGGCLTNPMHQPMESAKDYVKLFLNGTRPVTGNLCCAPRTYRPLRIVFTDPEYDTLFIVKEYPNFIANSCECLI